MTEVARCKNCGIGDAISGEFCDRCSKVKLQKQHRCPTCLNLWDSNISVCPSCNTIISNFEGSRQEYKRDSNINWFKRHLNWVWGIALLARVLFIFLNSLYGYIASDIFFLVVTLWCLKQKGRSFWWILIPIAVLFLENKRITSDAK